MGKKDLKKQYKELTIDLVDILSEIDTTPTKKITSFIVKQFYNERIVTSNKHGDELRDYLEYSEFSPIKNQIDYYIKDYLHHWIGDKLPLINEFVDHLENKRLNDLDINNYDGWNKMSLAVNEANLKYDEKSKKNRVIVLHDDSEWLIIKPLSLEASINYGYGAKWCTAMKNNSEYFYRYSKKGVLVYVINKTNDNKYGFFSSPEEYSVWNKEDVRIDSLSTIIPFELLIKLREWMDYERVGVNYNYFDEEDKERPIHKLSKQLTEDYNLDFGDNQELQLQGEIRGEMIRENIDVRGLIRSLRDGNEPLRLTEIDDVEFISQPANIDIEDESIIFPEMTNRFMEDVREYLSSDDELVGNIDRPNGRD